MENKVICYHCFRELKPGAQFCDFCGHSTADEGTKYPHVLPCGTILGGRYIVGHVLGQGGFGITYIAQEYKTKELVAVKEFFPESMVTRGTGNSAVPFSDASVSDFEYGKTTFLQEAETLAQFIGNPNIVGVKSYFEENGTAYFAMEYVEGISLQKYLNQHGGKLPWNEMMAIMTPIMHALQTVHAKGIIHRDIKPDNIIIDQKGVVKLLDFGSARYSMGEKSRSLDVILTHGFAPKEQYSRHGRQGAYTDIYALAATMYYALTGRKPPDSIDRADEDDLVPPSTLGVRLPEDQENALLKALAVAPADRYQDVGSFLQALGAGAGPDQVQNPEQNPEQGPATVKVHGPGGTWDMSGREKAPEPEKTVLIIFQDTDGTILAKQNAPLGSQVSQPAVQPKPGFRFTGWKPPLTPAKKDQAYIAVFERVQETKPEQEQKQHTSAGTDNGTSTVKIQEKTGTIIKTAIGIVVVLALAVLISVNCGYLQKHATAVTVGTHKVTPVEFNYYYQDAYSNFISTYYQYIYSYGLLSEPTEEETTELATSNITQVYTLYDAAIEAGYELDQDSLDSIDSTITSIEEYADSNGYKDADDYLEEHYGKGATLESYKEYVTIQQIASEYSTEKSDSFTYTDAELRTYYNDNVNDFDTVTYRSVAVTTDDSDSSAAKDTADAMCAELTGTEKSFADVAYAYATGDEKEAFEDEDYTLYKNTSYSSLDDSYADWLFSTDRVEGESQVFETDSGYTVVMFVSRENNEYNTVNVRHILAQVATSGDDDTSTDADWEECKEKIDEIEAEWEETDGSEDAFAELADEESEDTGSNTNGGLYEDVYKGEMVQEFEDWCFDPARQIGDTGIVRSDFGYHLMYFCGTGEEYWKELADDAKRSEDYNTWYDDCSANYEAKTKWIGMLFTNKELVSYATSSAA